MGVVVAWQLKIGDLKRVDHALVFVPLPFLAPRTVAVNQVPQVDHQLRFGGVDLGNQLLKVAEVLALKSRPRIADHHEIEITRAGAQNHRADEKEERKSCGG